VVEPLLAPTRSRVIDPARWPDVARVPSAPARAAIARRLVARAVRDLPLRLQLGAATHGAGTDGDPVIEVLEPTAFLARLGRDGLIGFGESYQAGEWDSSDLVGALTILAGRIATLVPPRLQHLRSIAVRRHPHDERDALDASREDVSAHYDLSNELFSTFLDPTLTYSSALFDGPATWGALEAAQHRKIDRLLDGVGVRPGTRLLEIGTGWGELALRAAARGAYVTSLTLSERQAELARDRAVRAGVADRVDVRLRDYRDAGGTYDAIVSVEMVEAVGYANWPTYFGTLDRLLAPGGRVGLQAITMPDDRLEASRTTYTWIQKYIFPGGLLPSVPAIERTVARHTRLAVIDRLDFGPHYAETLRLWRERFDASASEIEALGFDETFHRMWRLYLAYSEAGFRSGYLDVQQFVLGAR